jgi:hypothetical protein
VAVGGSIGGQLQFGAFTVKFTEQLPTAAFSVTSVPEGTPSISQVFPDILVTVPADETKFTAFAVTLKL